MRRIVLVVTALALAAPAWAGTSPPGVNIRWDLCYADGGTEYKTFACDTNTGSESLVMSVELADPLSRVTGFEVDLVLTSATPVLPAWWNFKNPGSCRQAALSLSTLPAPTDVHCPDWSAGSAVGGIGSYTIGYSGSWPGAALVRAAIAAPSPGLDLSDGAEYFFGALTINHNKTVGTGACGGCATPVCLMISDVNVVHMNADGSPAPSLLLTHGANWLGSQIAGWQNGYVAAYWPYGHDSAGVPFDAVITSCVPYSTTAAKRQTWGAVKSLYR